MIQQDLKSLKQIEGRFCLHVVYLDNPSDLTKLVKRRTLYVLYLLKDNVPLENEYCDDVLGYEV